MKTVIVSEEERFDDEFKPPTKYFVVNALGEGVYFRTNSRQKAQEFSDELFGKGKYTVRVAMKASVR